MILIIPMAGRSSRFPGMKPKWMLTHPSGRFMAIEAIRGVNLEDFSKIVFVCLKEHETLHGFSKGFTEELEELNLLDKSEILYLDEPTKHQSETVAKAIEAFSMTEAIFVKDSDNYFEVKYEGNNTVCFDDLNYSGLIKPKNKSYIGLDEHGLINNIVEKKVISSNFCVGGYGFESATDFIIYMNKVKSDGEVYLSNVIFQMILDDKKFTGTAVNHYKDWGTLEDWDRFKRSYATLFLDLDGTLIKNSSAHFPPYIGNTPALQENVDIVRKLYASGKFQVVLTTSRPEKYRAETVEQLNREQIPYDHLILGLYHAKRIIINDYARSNPYKSCDAINLKRDSSDLKEILRESLGIDYEEI